jgi:hypothetical protein
MGADYIGWRSCRLQAELGVDGFLGKLKLRAYKRVEHENRGGDGTLAELEPPLVHRWGKGKGKRRVDSAQLMTALFIALDQPALVVAYARFFSEFLGFVDDRLKRSLGADGETVEIHVMVEGELDGQAAAKQAVDALSDLSAIASSRTIAELRDISSLLLSAVPGALSEGWGVVVDS